MKIENITKVIKDLKAESRQWLNPYELGRMDGYLEAAERELQTLTQLLEKAQTDV